MASLVIGTAGHIDHGKSALVEALTGTDPDRLKEEKARGITIELGFASCRVGDADLAFVDVPGHERFVRTMLAGAGGIDAVLLVVAADEGVKPQTREHFHICTLLGIERGVIALTKSDLADPETLALAALDVRELVAGSFMAEAPMVAVSARTREGLDELSAALAALAPAGAPRGREAVVRLPIDRAFTVRGFGAVVTGTLVSGRLAVGDSLEILPQGRLVRVRGLQVHGQRAAEVAAPRRVAANLGGAELNDLARGATLATPGMFAVTRRVDLHARLLAEGHPLRHGARVRVHHGTSDAAAVVSIAARRAAGSAPWVSAVPGELGVAIEAGGDAFVRLRMDRPLVLTRGDRVVIRSVSPAATVGGGVVLDPMAPGSGVRRATTYERFVQLDTDEGARVWLTEAGVRGVEVQALVRRSGLSPIATGGLVDRLCREGQATMIAGRVFDQTAVRLVEEHVLSALKAFHAAHPADQGISREALRTGIKPAPAPQLFEAMLRDLTDRRVIAGTDRLAAATHRATPAPDEARGRLVVLEMVRAAGLTPPGSADLAAAAGLAPPTLNRVAQALVVEGTVVRLAGMLFDAAALQSLKASIAAWRQEGKLGSPATIDVATFKEKFGVSRKYAIPLLEWLDRERVTRRVGDRRVVV